MMSLTNLSLLPELAAVEVPADVVNEDAEAVEPVCAEKDDDDNHILSCYVSTYSAAKFGQIHRQC